MNLQTIDWVIIALYFVISLFIGVAASKKAGKSTSQFFLSGRDMPWWLLGVSMVATTFSSDTPNLVTNLVRQNGVSGNWGWWAFLVTGMLTVFVYAKLWRRSKVMTDIEFYELRYSGKPAAFLRGFRALYLGLVFNTLIMGTVALAAVKFGEVMLGIPGWQVLLVAGSITLVYSAIGGLRAVILTDFVQFILAMIGSIWAAIYLVNLDEVGGLGSLISADIVSDKLAMWPDLTDASQYIPILLVPLAVQWWASYYPGAEPGGGGYIAQRMFSAKDEKNAINATLFFNIAHYAIRPWPWILIALASLLVFPELSDLTAAFPELSADKLGHDVAYPAMLTLLPVGLIGLVSASLIAAFMSTMSSQLNLGASYLVNDFYRRFLEPDASEQKLVWIARLFTVITMVIGCILGLLLNDASQAFNLLLLLGAGTGLIYILRWFWWRINAYTEIIAMVASLIIAGFFTFFYDQSGLPAMESWQKLVLGVVLTTIVWVVGTFLTRPTDNETLRKFYKIIKPASMGWRPIVANLKSEEPEFKEEKGQLPMELLAMVSGCVFVYCLLFATGFWIYGESGSALTSSIIAVVSGISLFAILRRVKTMDS